MLAVELLLLFAMLVFTVVVRWTWKNEDDKKVEVRRDVMFMAASDDVVMTGVDDFEAAPLFDVYSSNKSSPPSFDVYSNKSSPAVTAAPPSVPPYECAVCCAFTTTRCKRCKAVRYCSSKCQIMHWRQGHKYECNPPAVGRSDGDYLNGNVESSEQCETNGSGSAEGVWKSSKDTSRQMDFESSDSHNKMPRLSTVTNEVIDLTTRSSHPNKYVRHEVDNDGCNVGLKKDNNNIVDLNSSSGQISSGSVHSVNKLNRESSRHADRRKSRGSILESSLEKKKNSSEGSISRDVHRFETKEVPDVEVLQSVGQEHSQSSKHHEVKSFDLTDSSNISLQSRSRSSSSHLPHIGLKSSLQKVVHSLKASHHKKLPHQNSLRETSGNQNLKAIFHYGTFLKLYSSNEVELKPFGLINCGNSCYANAVLQCLAYTRPLTLYLLQGLHSKECWKEEWCFICEFEHLIQKAREGYTPLSPIRILSNISHLGHGKEEDAHEFLRYAVESMQSVCVQLAGFVGTVAEETTLISMTFGGYLYSKIKCLKCRNKSEMYERMMDLTVEIDGDIRSLEQALRRFTASEILEGKNKYLCSRCKSYEKAKKKLSVSQAPNILTIVLKRFEAGTFTKLNKVVQFPHNLDMTPFMSHSSDGYPKYNLYAVVTHLDVKSAAFCGHYVCYVKNYHEEWFKIDDSVVIRVDLESVLAEEAYILLYARQSPRATGSSRGISDDNLPAAVLHAVPNRVSGKSAIPKARHRSSDPVAMQHQPSRKSYAKDSPYLEEWVTHSVESIPRVDSSSEVSSLFSNSEEGTCSTPSTKESASVEDFSEYIFGRGGVAGR